MPSGNIPIAEPMLTKFTYAPECVKGSEISSAIEQPVKKDVWLFLNAMPPGTIVCWGIMGLLPDTQNCGLCMHRERFPHHRSQRKPPIGNLGMHHTTCVTHVAWCMSGSLTHGSRENVPIIPGACATHNFAYLVWGPWGSVMKKFSYWHTDSLSYKEFCKAICSAWV